MAQSNSRWSPRGLERHPLASDPLKLHLLPLTALPKLYPVVPSVSPVQLAKKAIGLILVTTDLGFQHGFLR